MKTSFKILDHLKARLTLVPAILGHWQAHWWPSLEAASVGLRIFPITQQQRCRDACQISERYAHYNIQSCGFDTSRDLAVRRRIVNRGHVNAPDQYYRIGKCTIRVLINTVWLVLGHRGEDGCSEKDVFFSLTLVQSAVIKDSETQANSMMTSSNGNIFRVTGHLCGEFTGHRWIPRTKASDAEFCFLWSAPEWTLE